jgi:hypothetical protein
MKAIIPLIVIILIGAGVYYFTQSGPQATTPSPVATTTQQQGGEQATTTAPKTEEVIGTSVQGRQIVAYHYGSGTDEVLFVGDIHGGYTPGTALLAYKAMDYFKENVDVIPSNVAVTIIPVLNPDGLESVVGTASGDFTSADIPTSKETQIAGRFNANKVDLNRNFDCEWKPTAVWEGRTVSGGSAAFSEPESQAIRAYIESHKPKAVVVWYGAEGGVYASSCGSAPLSDSIALTKSYAAASGYVSHLTYSGYPIPGDMANWLANRGTPAISVLLKSRLDSDWTNNLAGMKAVLKYYTK